ncbi:MAG: DegV family protein [Ruminococcus sp.]|nr:DegV family protein [Ruminococcus sp.]
MKVKIISDSTCDLSPELIEKYDISIVPLYVNMADKVMKDGTEVIPDDIYSFVKESGVLPKTAAPNIGDFLEIFNEWHDKGYSIVHFNISSDFSSSYNTACLAAKEVGDVEVVDSRNLSTGQGLVVLYGAELAAQGKSAEEIKAACDAITPKVEASFVVDSIDYLYKGGRCSAVAALGANLLKLKPLIDVVDGKMTSGKKYRGNIDKVILNYVDDKLRGRDDIDYKRIFITHTKCNPEVVEQVKAKIQELCPQFEEVLETTAGCTVTSHCGPNTLGVLFIRNK